MKLYKRGAKSLSLFVRTINYLRLEKNRIPEHISTVWTPKWKIQINWVTQTIHNSDGGFWCSGMVSISCSTCGKSSVNPLAKSSESLSHFVDKNAWIITKYRKNKRWNRTIVMVEFHWVTQSRFSGWTSLESLVPCTAIFYYKIFLCGLFNICIFRAEV